ncbi:Calx-beta domain-containing protein, partial [Cylindrospermopsis raciborskii]|uniref:Calx-beta domain-containing protein n=1 Tax=Cylindrospermopsis raciborskii TaxID=77022 RepID=UPI001F0F8D33
MSSIRETAPQASTGVNVAGTYSNLASYEVRQITSTSGSANPVEIENVYGASWMRDQFPGTNSESIGDHSALYMRLTFPDVNRAPNTLADAMADMADNSLAYITSSRGIMTVSPTYTPVITLPFSYNWLSTFDTQVNGLSLIQTAAQYEARKLGFNPDDYNVKIVRVDQSLRDGASWGGGDSVWLGWGGFSVIVHEAGHALGIGHARSVNWNGEKVEYGNQFDWMGGGGELNDHFSLNTQADQGWVDKSDILVNPGSGVYRLHALDSGRQVVGEYYGIRQTIASDSLGNNPVFTLEYRPLQPGLEESIILLRNDEIIDLTPGTSTQSDGGIRLAQTYGIPGSNAYFTVVNKGDGYLDVAYQQGPFPDNVAPSVTFNATATTVKRFDSVTFTAAAQDDNGDQLVYAWVFSDGVRGAGASFTRSFNQSSVATVNLELTVSDMRGGVTTITQALAVGAATTGSPVSKTAGPGTSTPTKPRVSLIASDAFATEDNDSGSFTISRVGTDLSAALVVKLAYSGDGVDRFNTLPSTVTIPAGQSSTTLTLTPNQPTYWVLVDGGYPTISGKLKTTTLRVADIDPSQLVFAMAGGYITNDGITATVSSSTISRSSGILSFWVQSFDNGNTKAVKLVLEDGANGILVKATEAKYTAGNQTQFNWNTGGTAGTVATSLYGNGYGVSLLEARGGALTDSMRNEVVGIQRVDLNGSLNVRITADSAYDISSQNGSARMNLLDNDSPVVTIKAIDAIASEPTVDGRDTGMVLISRTGSTDQDLTVYYGVTGTAFNGGDFARLDGQIVIPVGQSYVSMMINPLGDREGEGSETVRINLASFDSTYSMGLANEAIVTIVDDNDLPTVSVRATNSSATEGGTARVVFTAIGGGSEPITVNYTIGGTATSGSDFKPVSGSITIATGGSQRSVELPIETLTDALNENDEVVSVTINGSSAYTLGLDKSAQITIAEPINTSNGGDRVRVTRHFGNLGLEDPVEGGNSLAFYIYRENTTGNKQTLTVNFSLSGTATPGVDYVDYTGIIRHVSDNTEISTFTPGASGNSVTIGADVNGIVVELRPTDDNLAEGTETISLQLTSVSGSQSFYPLGVNTSVDVNLLDNDTSTIQVGFASKSSLIGEQLDPAGNIRQISVNLNQSSSEAVSVRYRPSGGSAEALGSDWTFLDGNGNPVNEGVLTFAPGETTKAITVRVQSDRIPENQESFGIVLERPTGASLKSGYNNHFVTVYDVIPEGLIKEERWSGGSVFTNDSWDTSPISYVGYLNSLTPAQNVGSDFSRRLTGWITAPATGTYEFYIAADDDARLFLGTSDAASSKSLVASQTGWVNFQQWTSKSSQKSAAINLIQGQRYYIEVQHRENSGGDHLSVAWTGPGISTITPIITGSSILPSADNRYIRFLEEATTLAEGQSGQIVVTLDRANPSASTTVGIEVVSGGTASQGTDFSLASTTLTFAPGEITKSINISALTDSLNEASEQVSLRLVNANGAQIINPNTHQLNVSDANAPAIPGITGFSQRTDAVNTLIGQFSATPAQGRTIQNWSIVSGNPRVQGDSTGAFAIDNQGRVTLANPGSLPLGSYQFQVTVRGTDNLGASSLSTATIVVGGRRIVEERWNGQAAYNSKDWSSTPAVVNTLTSFDAPRDVGESYSRRITGVFTAPTNGDYSFWIAARDVGRLTIAPYTDPTSEQEIATSNDVPYQDWTTQEVQQSPPQTLVAGQRYILRAYQREHIWGDHLSVAWSGPGFARRVMTDSDFLPVQASTLVDLPPLSDTNPPSVSNYTLATTATTDTGTTAGIASGSFTRDNTLGLSGTADANALVRVYDGNTYLGQTRAQTNGTWSLTTPILSEGDHTLRAEVLDGYGNIAITTPATFTVRSRIELGDLTLVNRPLDSSGGSTTGGATDLIREINKTDQGIVAYGMLSGTAFVEQRWSDSSVYNNNNWNSTTPTYTGTLTTLVTAENIGNDYSRRITGTITVPTTGQYTFYIASDDSSRLFLSTDTTAANKVQIASVGDGLWTDSREWNKYSSQKSNAISLQAGQSYYIEIQHLEGSGGDHVAVGWTGPGISQITPVALPTSLVVADAINMSQLVDRSLASATTPAGVNITYGKTSPNGRYVVFGSSASTAFGNGGTNFTDTNPTPENPYSDLFVFDRSDASLRLMTGRNSPTQTASKQSELVGITSDNQHAIYTTDHVELIGNFSAPGKPGSSWLLVNSGYPTAAGSTKNTAVRVADLDPSKLSLRLNGSSVVTKDQLGVVRSDTIQRSGGSLSFWVETSQDTLKKAVKLEISDSDAGLIVKALQSKSPEVLISSGNRNGQANLSRTGGVGQTFTTSSLGSSNLLRTISIDGPTSNAASTVYTLKVWENNGLHTTFAPSVLVATSTNALPFTNNSASIFQFSGEQLSSDKVYVFSLSSGGVDHTSFRAGVTNAGTMTTGQLFSSLNNTWDLGFNVKLEPDASSIDTINWESQGNTIPVATTATTSGVGLSSLSVEGSNLSPLMFNEVGQSPSRDLVAYNLTTGEQKLLSHSSASDNKQSQAANVANATLSAGGRYVLFTANDATKLGNSGTAFSDSAPSATDLFATDLQTNQIRLLSHTAASNTTSAGVGVTLLDTSADDSFAIFSSNDASAFGFSDSATGAADLFAVSLSDGTIRLISRSSAGATTTTSGQAVTFERIVGNYVYFSANDATKLGFASDGDTNKADLFRYNLTNNTVQLLSYTTSSTSVALNASYQSGSLTVSPDGRYVVFVSNIASTNGDITVGISGNALLIVDTQTGAIRLLNASNQEGTNLSYGAWSPVASMPRFFTADSKTLVWQTSYTGWIAINNKSSGSGYESEGGTVALSLDLSNGLSNAGTAQVSRVISHTSSGLDEIGKSVTLLGVSADSRLAFFSSADATSFGNDGVAFTDSATSSTDIFAVDLSTRRIDLVSGQNGASLGQVATFQGISDGGSVLFSLGNVGGINTVAGTLTDSNGNGTDILARRFNLIDLVSADDTDSPRDNITSSRNFTLESWATPGLTVQLKDGDSLVTSQTAQADGRLRWQLSNVAPGEHNYSLWHPTEGIPIRLASPLGASTLTVTVTGSTQNDDATLAIASTNATQTEGNSGTKAFTFTVTRSGNTNGTSSANWAVTGSSANQADATDFNGTLPSGTVSFAAGETTQTITVNVSGDNTVEPDEGFTVTLSSPTNATITTATATGSINNDDTAPVVNA